MSLFTSHKIATLLSLTICCSITGYSQVVTNFSYTGDQQTYTVPAGVAYLTVDAIGAAGGLGKGLGSTTTNSAGGNGGEVKCKLAVTMGEVIYIFVGGKGVDGNLSTPAAGGFNGGGVASQSSTGDGGGGGGATDLRVGDNTFSSRVVVAGGGGGGGGDPEGSGCTSTSNGGAGGGLYAGNGYACGSYSGYCGSGAFPGNGGAGAVFTGVTSGGTGQWGQGGGSAYEYPGGGGGGGEYGGGGGVMGGGGGGGAYTDPATVSSVIMVTGSSSGSGNGSVSLTTIPFPAGVAEIAQADAIEVYPNPANDILTIKIEYKQYSLLRITNSLGQLVLQQTVDGSSVTTDIHQLSPALYNITLTGEGGSVTKRFIKE